jgi:hypothetical protein
MAGHGRGLDYLFTLAVVSHWPGFADRRPRPVSLHVIGHLDTGSWRRLTAKNKTALEPPAPFNVTI